MQWKLCSQEWKVDSYSVKFSHHPYTIQWTFSIYILLFDRIADGSEASTSKKKTLSKRPRKEKSAESDSTKPQAPPKAPPKPCVVTDKQRNRVRNSVSRKKSHLFESKSTVQDKLLSKLGGPFVHVEGSSSSNVSWSKVINASTDVMSAEKQRRRGIDELEHRKVFLLLSATFPFQIKIS